MPNQYVNKVVYGGQTLIDLTSDTITAADLAEGITAHDKSSRAVHGWQSQRFTARQTARGLRLIRQHSTLRRST